MCADKTTETLEYKTTLNLPQTDFPMRAGLPKREPEWLAHWDKLGVYDQLREKAKVQSARRLRCMMGLLMPTGICTLATR